MDHGTNRSPRRQNDRYLKDVFEQNFADFLRFVFPNADERFDLSREAEFLDKEFSPPSAERGDGKGNRIVDLLAKVHLNGGGEEWILVHTEIEGGNRAELPFRIFDYWLRIWLKHKRDVETIVFFTGGEGQPKPSVFETGTETTRVRFQYQTCDIHRFSDEELMAMDNPFSVVVLACRASLLEGKISNMELNKIRLDIARKMIRDGLGKDRTEMFLFFLSNIIHTGDPEMNREYMEEIGILTRGTIDMTTIELARKYGLEDGVRQGHQQGLEQGRLQGLEQGRQQGLEQGRQQGLEQGLEQGRSEERSEERARIAREMRKAGVSIEQTALFTRLTVAEVERL